MLEKKISLRSARIGVLGLGYVGLPLACEFAQKGFSVIGFDVDEAKIRELRHGRSYIADIPTESLAPLIKNKKLFATTDFSALKSCDVAIICVPTPLRKTKDPDISYIASS